MIISRPNVSAFAGLPPSQPVTHAGRRIAGGPLYAVEEVLALVAADKIVLWTEGARRDAAKWSLDGDDISELVTAALHDGRYDGSEWCEQRPCGPWAACDAYVVSRAEWIPSAHKHFRMTYFLKFAISKTGTTLLSISNHPEHT